VKVAELKARVWQGRVSAQQLVRYVNCIKRDMGVPACKKCGIGALSIC
jgi:hypothetical protein